MKIMLIPLYLQTCADIEILNKHNIEKRRAHGELDFIIVFLLVNL